MSDDEVEVGEMSVPTELLDLHVQLEEAGVTPETFKEVYGAEVGDESPVGGKEAEEGSS